MEFHDAFLLTRWNLLSLRVHKYFSINYHAYCQNKTQKERKMKISECIGSRDKDRTIRAIKVIRTCTLSYRATSAEIVGRFSTIVETEYFTAVDASSFTEAVALRERMVIYTLTDNQIVSV